MNKTAPTMIIAKIIPMTAGTKYCSIMDVPVPVVPVGVDVGAAVLTAKAACAYEL